MAQEFDRAGAILEAARATAATKARSGRYKRSESVAAGVRFWATTSKRFKEDRFGLQLFGAGLRLRESVGRSLEARGFEVRNDQTGQITFCRAVPFKADGSVDEAAILSTRGEIEALLEGRDPGGAPQKRRTGADFIRFIQDSPLMGVELELPRRGVVADQEPGLG
jgi:hypothetical protein